MKNLLCPQCQIRRFYVLNAAGHRLVVTVSADKKEIHPIHENESLDGFDTSLLYCLGCSWKGTVNNLV